VASTDVVFFTQNSQPVSNYGHILYSLPHVARSWSKIIYPTVLNAPERGDPVGVSRVMFSTEQARINGYHI